MSDFALSIKNTSRDLEVQKYPPILTPEQEYELAIELYENGSLSAAKKLVLAHMRFVAFIAHSYKGYGLENADLLLLSIGFVQKFMNTSLKTGKLSK